MEFSPHYAQVGCPFLGTRYTRYSLEARRIIFPGATITLVLGLRSLPQIGYPIISPIAIDMVYLIRGPHPVCV